MAYEIAQQLRTQGQPLALLLLMDTPRPHALWALQHRVVDPLTRHCSVTSWRDHHAQLRPLPAKEKCRYLLQKVRALPQQSRQWSYARALYRYRPGRYGGKMTLIVNAELYRRRPHLGWAGLGTGGMEIYPVPGNHDSYIRDHVQSTAQKILACLEKATQ